MTLKHVWGMALGAAVAFVFFALMSFGAALVSDTEGVFNIAGGVKHAFICIGIVIGAIAALAGAAAID